MSSTLRRSPKLESLIKSNKMHLKNCLSYKSYWTIRSHLFAIIFPHILVNTGLCLLGIYNFILFFLSFPCITSPMYFVGLFQQSSNARKTPTTLRIPNRNVTIYILKSNVININSAVVLNLRTDKIIVAFLALICERDKTFVGDPHFPLPLSTWASSSYKSIVTRSTQLVTSGS
jgi:hypothetical protein